MALETTSPPVSPVQTEKAEGTATTPDRAATRAPLSAVAFVALFGVLLASFPARNLDVWKHLADGRDLLRGMAGPSPTWLYDLATYGVFSVAGGTGLSALKALLCGAVAVLMFRVGGRPGGWRVAMAVTGLATLAMGNNRLLLQPATVSVLFLAVSLWLLDREETRPPAGGVWPGWRWVVLFAVWANVDGRFVLGLGLVAATWLGRLLDAPPEGFWRVLGLRAVSVAILVGAACLSPSHVNALLRVPPELREGVASLRAEAGAEPQEVNSPFDRDYLTQFRDRPAALSYYPLLALGLLSFLLNRRGWRWAWLLPWLGLAVVSGLQVRLVPFFAVAAGPVTAWNLSGFFARQGSLFPARLWVRYAALGFAVLLAGAFLVCAWPGWLQGPPFEPRRWAVEQPTPLTRGSSFLQRGHADGLWSPETRTLHVSRDTAAAFAWFCPEDRALRDDAAVEHLLKHDTTEKARERFRELAVNRVVVYAGDRSPSSRDMLDRLLIDPGEWPILHLTGGLVVFGWRDPARAGGLDPFAGREVDFARLAFRPDESEVAPPARPPRDRRWTDPFWKPAPPPRPAGRDEATVLLKKAEALRQSAGQRHIGAWQTGQAAGIVGAAGGWMGPHAVADAALRLALLDPPPPGPGQPDGQPPPITRTVFGLFRGFMFDRGDAPVGVLYAATRAARRATAENPNDADAHLALGRAYLALVGTTAEQSWASQVPQLLRIRQLQASAALNRAVALNPRLAQAHLELGRLYLTLHCLDLAVFHLRAYRDVPPRWGGPRKGDRLAEALDSELERLTKTLDRETREFEKESEKSGVSDRAMMAVRRGLAGQARDLLLKSDVAAFGATGTELELNLLLQTGRPDDVLEWMTPEVRGSLGDFLYHSLRAQAYIAAGEYEAADGELAEMVGPGGRLPTLIVGSEVAGLTGRALLEERPGGFSLPQLHWRTSGRVEFEERIAEIARGLARSADILVLRGIVALEAGNIDRARESFRAALVFSPARWGGGQLEFNGRLVAWDGLALIGP